MFIVQKNASSNKNCPSGADPGFLERGFICIKVGGGGGVGLVLFVAIRPRQSYGHVGTVSSPNHIFSYGVALLILSFILFKYTMKMK